MYRFRGDCAHEGRAVSCPTDTCEGGAPLGSNAGKQPQLKKEKLTLKIKVKDVQNVKLTTYPGDGGTTQVLEVLGHLTPAIATKLGIREGCYNDEGIPRNYETFPSSSLSIDGAEITLGEKDFRATLLHKFKAKVPKSKKQQGVALEVNFLIHFGGKEAIKFWFDRQNKELYTLNLNARQEDLKFGEADADDEEAADAAEPEESAEDTGCTSCNAGNPMGLGNFHLNGQKCTQVKEIAAPESETKQAEGPTLMPIVLAGGSHQKGTRGRRPRNPDAEAYADGSGPDDPVN
jgi:hypothetical protein